jgi:hypothetical protein
MSSSLSRRLRTHERNRRRPHRNDDRSVSNGRGKMERRGSDERDGGVRLHVLTSSDLPGTIILRSKPSEATQDKSSIPRFAPQQAPSRKITSDSAVNPLRDNWQSESNRALTELGSEASVDDAFHF